MGALDRNSLKMNFLPLPKSLIRLHFNVTQYNDRLAGPHRDPVEISVFKVPILIGDSTTFYRWNLKDFSFLTRLC